MFTNYLKIAFRILIKKKLFSFTNIIGLSTGMAVCTLISLWIWDEVSFDKYHDNYDRIAKVRLNVTRNGEITTTKTVPLPLVDELSTNFKEDFKYIVPSSHRANHVLGYGDKKLFKKGVYLGKQAPMMLSLKMIKGDISGLNERHSIILSELTAKVFFGDQEPVNKMMTIDNRESVKVTGVYKQLPDNTTFADLAFISPFDLYLSNETWITEMNDPWNENPIQLYVQFAGKVNIEKVSTRIKNLVQSKIGSNAGKQSALILEPMGKWHLYTYRDGFNNTGSIRYIKVFGLIGFFVLLLSCFNFMNLSTARSEKRAREVGVRKAIGSSRVQLIRQFFVESILLTLVAFAFSILIIQLALPFFNGLAGKNIEIRWGNIYFWVAGLLFSVVTGLLAGSYPAFYLSSFHPAKVLKGSLRVGGGASMFRKTLVIFQFSICVMLIICTVVVFRQIEHARERPSGYNPHNLVLVPMTTKEVPMHFEAVTTDLFKLGAVANMARSESTTTDNWATDSDLSWNGKDANLSVDFPNTGVSINYGKTVGWTFLAGRDFSSEFFSDSSGFILNQAAVKFMGLKNPVGEIIRWNGQPFTVIGVIKDMVVESPYDPVKPSIYCLARGHDNFAILRLNPLLKINKALSDIEDVFKKYAPSTPFEYEFINEKYDRKFRSEERVGKLAGFFTALAIFVSCLGIFAMASFMAERRSREIGVRKVFGASVFSIWKLLSKEFTELIVLSLIITMPVTYYFMYSWLQNYHYRTTIAWWILAVAALCILSVTLITASFQVIKAALTNPIKSLREV